MEREKWISVEQGLPDAGVPVLVRTKSGKFVVAETYYPKDCLGNVLRDIEWKGSYNFKESITHYQYICFDENTYERCM